MRKNGKRFQVDIVEGSWFSTVHESMSQAELKNVTTTPYTHLVYQLPHRSHIGHTFAVRNQKTTTVWWGDMQEKETGWKGILQIVFHLL